MRYTGIGLMLVMLACGPVALGSSHRGDDVPMAVAAVSAEEFAELKTNFAQLAQRFEELAAENAQLRQAQQQNQADVVAIRDEKEASAWTENIKIKGDFRYRYQNDDVDLMGRSDRNRQRIRARPAIIAKLPARTEVGFGLATGSDDPVSSNQTLGGGGSSKGINLDLAYFKWEAIEGLHLVGGKFKNEFNRTGGNGLLWDSDWRPEGFQVLYEQGIFFANGLLNWLEGDGSSGGGEKTFWGLQGGVNVPVGEMKLKAGVSYFDIPTQGEECFFDDEDCFGNSFVEDNGTLRYVFDYKEINAFAEFDFPLFGLPSQVFVDYVKNDDASDNDTGYAVGFRVGKTKKQGSWQFGYLYQDLEADAVLGLLTDSDFSGGGTDSKGHKLVAAYGLTDAGKVQVTYFATERQDTTTDFNSGVPFDINTLQVDFSWKYK
ncbi:MAG: putative porin [Gammaproteobacteria bacterium]|nr:putative porin [Gammaproteobacteria bacterium]